MKLTMREWAELDAGARMTETARKMGLRSHQLSGRWQREGEPARLTKLGLIRWTSKNRVTTTRKGFALLATKSKRFLFRAQQIAERDYALEY